MGYVVYRKGGMRDEDERAYMNLLVYRLFTKGADFADLPRAKEDPDGRWLYAFDDKAEAETFAEDLKKRAKDKEWAVRASKAPPSHGPLRPLDIEVSKQGGGWSFSLSSAASRAVRSRYPGSCPHPGVLIEGQKTDQFPGDEATLRRLGKLVLPILTGLEAEQLAPFVSFRLVDQVKKTVMVPPIPVGEINAR